MSPLLSHYITIFGGNISWIYQTLPHRRFQVASALRPEVDFFQSNKRDMSGRLRCGRNGANRFWVPFQHGIWYGGFHQWGYPKNRWFIMIYIGTSENKMDYLGYPNFRKPPYTLQKFLISFGVSILRHSHKSMKRLQQDRIYCTGWIG